MEFISKQIEDYARRITTPESPVLQKLNRDTYAMVLRPRMLSGHLQGKLLEMLSLMLRPDRILEIGTYTGYSAICLAKGLNEHGVLHTIDHNPELEQFAAEYIELSGLKGKVVQHIGEAMDILPGLTDTFDMVFIDADKINYINYFEMVYERTRPGGLIIADNVLWSGKVVDAHAVALQNQSPEKERQIAVDPDTLALVRFNEYIREHEGIHKLLLPFRDGLMLCLKY